jgi:hypothetical protein
MLQQCGDTLLTTMDGTAFISVHVSTMMHSRCAQVTLHSYARLFSVKSGALGVTSQAHRSSFCSCGNHRWMLTLQSVAYTFQLNHNSNDMQLDTDPKSPKQPGDNIQIMEQLCLPFKNDKKSILKVQGSMLFNAGCYRACDLSLCRLGIMRFLQRNIVSYKL